MFSGNRPDITQAQVLAGLTFVGTQAIAIGLVDNNQEKLLLMIGGTVIPAVWKIADAIIRFGRNKALVPPPPPNA